MRIAIAQREFCLGFYWISGLFEFCFSVNIYRELKCWILKLIFRRQFVSRKSVCVCKWVCTHVLLIKISFPCFKFNFKTIFLTCGAVRNTGEDWCKLLWAIFSLTGNYLAFCPWFTHKYHVWSCQVHRCYFVMLSHRDHVPHFLSVGNCNELF